MYWWKGTWITALELSQKNERENPEVDSHKYPQLIFMKMQRQSRTTHQTTSG